MEIDIRTFRETKHLIDILGRIHQFELMQPTQSGFYFRTLCEGKSFVWDSYGRLISAPDNKIKAGECGVREICTLEKYPEVFL